ncbi:MAG: hypothetical protein M1819_005434 [Sarea resinae]|nr:MAG: hypothetical protein M1819_005434 [Sarea resinae]
MEGRLKKLFLRKKEPERETAVAPRSGIIGDEAGLRTSAYESTSPARRPETGEFPLHGNRRIPTTDQHQERYQAVIPPRGHHPSKSEISPAARAAAAAAGRPKSYPSGNGPSSPGTNHASTSYGPNNDVAVAPSEARGREYIRLSNELSHMRLHDGNGRSHKTTHRQRQYANVHAAAGTENFQIREPQRHPYGDVVTDPSATNSDVEGPTSSTYSSADQYKPQRQNVRQRSPHKNYSLPRHNEDGTGRKPANEADNLPRRLIAANLDRDSNPGITPTRTPEKPSQDHHVSRRQSIPRKDIRNEASIQSASATSTSPESNRRRANIPDKPLPPPPGSKQTAAVKELPWLDVDRASNSEPPRPKTVPPDSRRRQLGHTTEKPSLAGIVDLGNSVDTEVIERIAPGETRMSKQGFGGLLILVNSAVTHETVTKKIHNIREEVVTREVHNHDVFHRILPIVDVEVLPTQHYVLDEEGGLVEIFAEEAPGRQGNWVLAETASKNASGEPTTKDPRRFSARQFPGKEGDSRQYTRPDGVKVTEETWVHAPTLETGARDTGQTTPIVFDQPRTISPYRGRMGKRPVGQQGGALQNGYT